MLGKSRVCVRMREVPRDAQFQEQPNVEEKTYVCNRLTAVYFSLCNYRKFRWVVGFTGLGILLI